MRQTTSRHGVFQAQVYHATHGHASGRHCQCTDEIAGRHSGDSTLKKRCPLRSSSTPGTNASASNKQIIKTGEQVKLPRVEQQIELTQPVPRVRFDESPPSVLNPPPRLIVTSPQKPIVERKIVEPPPKPILKPPKYIDDSIAARVREQRLQSQTTVNESIADRVARRRREAAPIRRCC